MSGKKKRVLRVFIEHIKHELKIALPCFELINV